METASEGRGKGPEQIVAAGRINKEHPHCARSRVPVMAHHGRMARKKPFAFVRAEASEMFAGGWLLVTI